MATITIENVPETFIKKFWTKVSFSTISISKKRIYTKKDPTIRLQKMVEDPENISYWPFDNVNDAINFLNRDLWK